MAQTVLIKEDLFFGKEEGVLPHNRKGLRPEEFIHKFITKKSTNNWTDEEALKYIVANLREEGHDWYSATLKAMLKGEEFTEAHTTWRGFITRFKFDFYTITSVHDLAVDFTALCQKQNESALDFTARTMRVTDHHATLLKEDWELPTIAATDINNNVSDFQTALRTLLGNVNNDNREQAKNATDIIMRKGAEFALEKYVSHTVMKVLINGLSDSRLRMLVKEFARTDPSMSELNNYIKLKVALLSSAKVPSSQKVHAIGENSFFQQEEEQEESNSAAVKSNRGGNRGRGRGKGRGRGGANGPPHPNNQNTTKPPNTKSNEECGFCFFKGHSEKECFKKRAAQDSFRKNRAPPAYGSNSSAVQADQQQQKDKVERPRYQEYVEEPRYENFGQEMNRRNGTMNHWLSEN